MPEASRFAAWRAATARGEPAVYVIAEMANAHDANLEKALAITRAAAAAGADAIKYQRFTAAELLVPQHSMYGVFARLEMPDGAWDRLLACGREMGLDVFCDVFGRDSLRAMSDGDVTGFKLHASEVPDSPFLERVGATGKPVLLSCGGATWIEIAEAVETLRTAGAPAIVLMHGFQLFPTPLPASGLARLSALARRFDLPVGYADHVPGDSPAALWLPLQAIGAGARVIEKHLTLERAEQGTDHHSSLVPVEFARLVQSIREAASAIGEPGLAFSTAEARYRATMKKRLVVARPVRAGQTLGTMDVAFRRVEEPRGVLQLGRVLGKVAARDLEANAPLLPGDVQMKVVATLACRARSTRLYAKPLQLVGDRPIIEHLIERLRRVKRLDGIVLAVADGRENQGFLAVAESLGLPSVVGDERDVLSRLITAAEAVNADVAVRVTTENPYVYHENIDAMIEHHLRTGADITICERLPNGTHVEVISLDALRRAHRLGDDRHRSELCTLFIFENADAFRIERVQAPEDVARPDLCLTVDTPEDLIVARAIHAGTARHDGPAPLHEIIKFLDLHPELRRINEGPQPLKLWP